MKYCSKCGNQMQDEMDFCPKCGTKFEDNTNSNTTPFYERLEKLKSYNLVLDSNIITWDYCFNSAPELLGKMSSKQSNLTDEAVLLVNDILNDKELKDYPEVEEEVYLYIFDLIVKMLHVSTQMLADYNGYKEFTISRLQSLDQHLAATRRNRTATSDLSSAFRYINEMSEKTFEAILSRDQIYRNIYGLQVLCASILKQTLNGDVINSDNTYKDLLETIAFSFKGYLNVYVKRYTDFGFCPAIDEICVSIWKIYCSFVDGLDYTTIKSLDDTIWEPIKNGKYDDKEKIIKRLKEQRYNLLCRLKDKENDKYYKEHPEIKKEIDELEKKLKQLKEQLCTVKEEKSLKTDEEKKFSYEARRLHTEQIELKNEIEKLSKKIFGKQKAKDKIEESNKSVLEKKEKEEKLTEMINSINEQIQKLRKKEAVINSEISEIENRLQELIPNRD